MAFEYQIVEEIPSADTLIFDHFIAQRIWGNNYLSILSHLALLPAEARDIRLGELYYTRKAKT